MARTYGQLADGITNYADFLQRVSAQLDRIDPNWNKAKTTPLIKRYYNKGYNISNTISVVL